MSKMTLFSYNNGIFAKEVENINKIHNTNIIIHGFEDDGEAMESAYIELPENEKQFLFYLGFNLAFNYDNAI